MLSPLPAGVVSGAGWVPELSLPVDMSHVGLAHRCASGKPAPPPLHASTLQGSDLPTNLVVGTLPTCINLPD